MGHSTDNVAIGATQLNFKNQAAIIGSGSFNLNSGPTSTRATQGNFNQVTTPVGNNNGSMIGNLYNMNASNSKATSVGPSGMAIQ